MQNKEQKIKYSFKKLLIGSDLSLRRLAIMEVESISRGPVVWITAAVHGDEVGGTAVIHEIFKLIRRHPLLKGSIKAMPLMNPIGFEAATRHISVAEEDLNRSFPGDKNGRVAERMAEQVFNTIIETKPSLVMDLHNDWTKSAPYLLLDPHDGPASKAAHEAAKKLAMVSKFIIIQEENFQEASKTLSGSMLEKGIPSLTLELGESYIVNEKNVQIGVAAIWNMLSELKMVGAVPELVEPFIPQELRQKMPLAYYDKPRSKTSGFIRYLTKPGSMIQAGEPIAKIYNVFGKLEETARAEKAGVVLGHPESAVAFPGAPLAAFGVFQ